MKVPSEEIYGISMQRT